MTPLKKGAFSFVPFPIQESLVGVLIVDTSDQGRIWRAPSENSPNSLSLSFSLSLSLYLSLSLSLSVLKETLACLTLF